MSNKTYSIDGATFSTLDQFYDVFGTIVLGNADWGRNLDAFNDVLRGGFGTPDDGFTLVWKNAALSRHRLGHSETARQLTTRLGRCHPSNRGAVEHDLGEARANRGSTVFDWLIEILADHGPNGSQGSDNVTLVLRE